MDKAGIKHDPRNARKHNPRNVAMVEQSIQRDGFGRSILLANDGTVIAGNATIDAAASAGLEDVIVVESDGTKVIAVKRTDVAPGSTEFHNLAIADNRAAELASWDESVIAALNEEMDLSAFFGDDELAKLLASVTTEGLTDPDDVPTVAEATTKPGDLWLLGRHRLLCGDSTVATDVERLMDGERAQAMWTDPPYGVNYVGKTKDALTIQNDGANGLAALLYDAFTLATTACIDGAAFYIARPPGALSVTFGNAILGAGWHIHEELQWIKDSMVLGHSDYHIKHETVVYGFMPGNGRRGRGGDGWYGGNSETSVFEVDRPKASPDHPTGKPVDLVAAHLRNSTLPSHIVYDPFLGSGTTLIAAEQLNRTCFGLEIDPHYCTVILQRWAAFTGGDPVRDDGVKWSDLHATA